MKYIVKCNFCDSDNLKKTDYIQGIGEGFECLNCGSTMSLREIEFEEIEDKSKTKNRCTACCGSGWYDSTDKHGNNIKCGACNGTGFEMD